MPIQKILPRSSVVKKAQSPKPLLLHQRLLKLPGHIKLFSSPSTNKYHITSSPSLMHSRILTAITYHVSSSTHKTSKTLTKFDPIKNPATPQVLFNLPRQFLLTYSPKNTPFFKITTIYLDIIPLSFFMQKKTCFIY